MSNTPPTLQQALIDVLVAAKALLEQWAQTGQAVQTAAKSFSAAYETGMEAVEADAKEVADALTKAIPGVENAVSTFEIHGPMGLHGESKP